MKVDTYTYLLRTHKHTHSKITDLVVELKQLLVVKINKDIFLNLKRERDREREREVWLERVREA